LFYNDTGQPKTGSRVGKKSKIMSKFNLTATEQEMVNFKFDDLDTVAEKAKTDIANAKSAADVKTAICNLWSKVPGWAKKLLEAVPVVGKFFTLIADALDSLCRG
jgi:hypothetical protein